ncbi:MAG: N-acetyltransferase family protein [Hyphomicrobiales bacterium]
MDSEASPGRGHEIVLPEPFTLRDGREVVFRRIRPDDAQQLVEGFRRLSPESRRRRFFSPLRELDPALAGRLANVDFVRRAAFVATFPGEDIVRAVARYEQVDSHTAEVAFTVADELQGQGIASHLLHHLAALARLNGIDRFVADVLAENSGMLEVFAGSGLPMRSVSQGLTWRVTLDIRERKANGA